MSFRIQGIPDPLWRATR